jgi:CRISPR/Cas system-associated protein Csx1
MRIKNKHKHTLRRPHLQQGGGSKQNPPSCRKDKKINQMSLKEVQNKIEFLKARNEYNAYNKYADALTDRFLELLKQDNN